MLFLSNSEIESFTRCRRTWYLSSYLGARPRVASPVGPLPFGTRFHAALEGFYRDGVNPVQEWVSLIEADRLALTSQGFSTEDLDKDDDLGRIMLEGWLEWCADEGLDAHHEILGVEDTLTYTPDELPNVTFVGKADLRTRHETERTVRVVDFKTASAFTQYTAMSDLLPQAKMYLLLDSTTRAEGDIADGFTFRVAKKVKRTARATPPFYQEFHVRHSAQTLETFRQRLLTIGSDISRIRGMLDNGATPGEAGVFSSPSTSCTFMCGFIRGCGLFDDDPARAQDFLDTEYTLGNNTLERYGDSLA
jgi:RecB family exonuclease